MGFASKMWTTLGEETTRLIGQLRLSVVVVHSSSGQGSGLIWDSKGLIVTNNHVLAHSHAEVELVDGRWVTAQVVARDPQNDLAALLVDVKGLSAAVMGDSRTLRVGELLMAIGHPFGLRGSITLGIVSATESASWMGQVPREILLADLLLAPGNSGGPLANLDGCVVGLASMVLSSGSALAIPSHVVSRFMTAVKEGL